MTLLKQIKEMYKFNKCTKTRNDFYNAIKKRDYNQAMRLAAYKGEEMNLSLQDLENLKNRFEGRMNMLEIEVRNRVSMKNQSQKFINVLLNF